MASPFTFRRLDPDELRPPFDCGDKDLNEFFSKDSIIADRQLLSVTYVAERSGSTISFFSVSNAIIRRDDLPKSRIKKLPHRKRYKVMPAVSIARFATSSLDQSTGVGTQILDSIKVSFTHDNKTGCRFIVVDAYNNDRTIRFYEKNGFTFLLTTDKKDETRMMYFDLITFRK